MKIWIWDVPILFLLGAIAARMYGKWLVEKHPDFYVHSAIIINALFWLNALVSAFGASPWLGSVKHTVVVPGWIALFYVLSYPLWFHLGGERTLALFGRNPSQGGFLWPFTVKDRTKPFKAPWKQAD
jgi:hypothetical protein